MGYMMALVGVKPEGVEDSEILHGFGQGPPQLGSRSSPLGFPFGPSSKSLGSPFI